MKALIPIIVGILVLTAIGVTATEPEYMRFKNEIRDAVENFSGTEAQLEAALETSCFGVVTDRPVVQNYFKVITEYWPGRSVKCRQCVDPYDWVSPWNGKHYTRCGSYNYIDCTEARCYYQQSGRISFKTWWVVKYNYDLGWVEPARSYSYIDGYDTGFPLLE